MLLYEVGSRRLPPMPEAYIGLGANVGDRLKNLRSAVSLIRSTITSPKAACTFSPLYESLPIGVTDQPLFLNAVLLTKTDLKPFELLDALQLIEHEIGRRPGRRWGPRHIDLDLLLYGEIEMNTTRLILPHPRLSERAFVLGPLTDLDTELNIPGETFAVGELLTKIDASVITCVQGPNWAMG